MCSSHSNAHREKSFITLCRQRQSKGTGHMHSHIRFKFILGIAAASLMSSAALTQESQLNAGPPATTVAPTKAAVTAATTTVSASDWLTGEAAGQWRGSRMIGLRVYNDANEKIGDIAELIVDRSGKIEAVVVGAGGFLGIGERDIAVPYSQINWVFAPVGPVRISTGPIPSETARSASDRYSYPDHAVLDMTKDDLKAAPAFAYSH
jgi:sporulation protein YlmC with PRC-barrel domain